MGQVILGSTWQRGSESKPNISRLYYHFPSLDFNNFHVFFPPLIRRFFIPKCYTMLFIASWCKIYGDGPIFSDLFHYSRSSGLLFKVFSSKIIYHSVFTNPPILNVRNSLVFFKWGSKPWIIFSPISGTNQMRFNQFTCVPAVVLISFAELNCLYYCLSVIITLLTLHFCSGKFIPSLKR